MRSNRVRLARAALTATRAAGCGSSPASVDIVETPVPDFTVTFDGLQLTLERANYGWVPAEGPVPPFDPVRMTVRVRVVNTGDGPRTLAVPDLRFRTWDGTYPYDPPHNTPSWFAVPEGRGPALATTRLAVGEAAEGWLTCEVPRRDARRTPSCGAPSRERHSGWSFRIPR